MNMPENLYLEFDAFLRSIKQNLDGSFGVLLGAGASISSGIQSANDCIWDWKFLIYQSLSGNQKKLVDPKKSDLSKDIIQMCKGNIHNWGVQKNILFMPKLHIQ